jgi:HK97 family phage major capsid protein
MDPKEELKKLRKKAQDILDKAKAENRLFTDGEQTEFDSCLTEIKKIQQTIDSMREFEIIDADLARVITPIDYGKPKDSDPKLFKNLGEQLVAIQKAGMNASNTDSRLLQINNAASGSHSGAGQDGSFVIQSDFSAPIIDTAFQESGFLNMCDVYDLGENSNGIATKDIDESSIATSVYGGVVAYWGSEAGTVDASKPKFHESKLDLAKIMGIGYATDEILQDARFMSQLYSRSFSAAITRTLEGGIISGDGLGKTMGILKTPSLVTVAAEGSQSADTLIHQNIVKMWLRSNWQQRKDMVWLIHPDLEEQLELMIFAGSTSNPIPLYMPAGGLANDSPLGRIKGRPVILTDNCSAVGDVGDIILANMKEYRIIRKGGIEEAQSLHVRFLYGENTFRFTFRVNGAPKKKSALTIKNSTNTRSPFVTLAAR